MDNGGEGGEKYGGNGVGAGSVGVVIWEREWVVTESMLKLLEGFHHRVARKI